MNEENGLKAKVISGVVWTFGERIIAQGVAFIVSIILARILMPEQYGIIAMVMVFINIADVFVSNGFGESLIQKQDSDETDFSTVFFCSLLLSIFLYVLLFVTAPLIAQFYNTDQLTWILRILALKILFSSISTIQSAYVSRNMIFKKNFFSTFGGTLISGIVGIVMAVSECGVWALVAQYLTNTIINTIVLYFIIPWRPCLKFSMNSAKILIGYGWKITVASLINSIYTEFISLIIGKVYSSNDLAYYNKGKQLPGLLISNVDTAIGRVIFPAMSKTNQDMARLKAISRRAMKTTAYIIFPFMAGLIVVAKPLIIILLTDKWLPCVPYLQIACCYWVCQPLQTTNWQIIKAVGRSDLCFKLEFLKKAIGIMMILVSMKISVMAIAASAALFGFISMIINIIPNKTLIGYSIIEQIRDVVPLLILSGVMGVGIHLFSFLSLPIGVMLFLQVFVGGIFYIGISYCFEIDSFMYLLKAIHPKISALKGKISNDIV